ncbi:MAG: molybdenum cofactor guanylyltransferase [Candidatus Bathyarchaeota archaeon]|nr:MAG: molybdenum cofactor guanylyltransferase [Candidatus Bathyarchaeota archaeon]
MLGALILAGGQAKRIKENKALLQLGEKPLLFHVLEKIFDVTHEIVVVIGKRDNPLEFKLLLPSKVILVQDKVYGQGPLGGIFTGFKRMQSEYALVTPVDSPFIKKSLLEYLISKASSANAVIPLWPNGNLEPLHAIYRISAVIPAAKNAIINGEFQMLKIVKKLRNVTYLNTDYLRRFDKKLLTFFNINDRNDLEVARNLFKGFALK